MSEEPHEPERRWDFSILRTLRKQHQWSIAELAERAEVAASVISKLERNRTKAELETLYRLSQVFSLTLSDLLGLAEKRTAQQVEEVRYQAGGFQFARVTYGNLRCMHGTAPAGAKLFRPDVHREDSELCWVRRGRVAITVAGKRYLLGPGTSLQFDALLRHEYEVLEDCELFIAHVKKGKRF